MRFVGLVVFKPVKINNFSLKINLFSSTLQNNTIFDIFT